MGASVLVTGGPNSPAQSLELGWFFFVVVVLINIPEN